MVRDCGYKFFIKANALYKILMAHKHTKDEAVEEAERATEKLFEDTDIEMYEEFVEKVKQGTYFDAVILRFDLRMNVTAHDVDDAYGEAIGMVYDIDLSPCVTLEDVEPYYAEQDTDRLVEAM